MKDLFGKKIEVKSGADFSEDRKYRYRLWRIWDESLPQIMFIGLNPSTANETMDDPTIRRVKKFAEDWDYGGVYMMNCWPFVTSDPTLLQHNEVSDRWNNDMLTVTAAKCKNILFAWGNFKIVTDKGRDKELSEMFPNAICLGLNKNGSPKHPLYIAASTKPVPYNLYIKPEPVNT